MTYIDEQETAQLERYLLGDLPETELHTIEGRLLEHRDLFAQVEALEDDLVDRYVHGELSPGDRSRFELRLLPLLRIRERVAFARGLARLTESYSSRDLDSRRTDAESERVSPFQRANRPRRPLTTRLAWAACLVATVGAGVLGLVDVRLQRGLQRAMQQQQIATARATAAEQEASALSDTVVRASSEAADTLALQKELAESREKIAALEQRTEELEKAPKVAEHHPVAAGDSPAAKIVFLAFATRGNETPTTISLPAPGGVALQLDLDRRHPEANLTATVYRISSAGGGKSGLVIWKQADLTPVFIEQDGMVPVTLPEPVLQPGAYRVEITGDNNQKSPDMLTYEFYIKR